MRTTTATPAVHATVSMARERYCPRVAKKRVFECEETDRPGCKETENGKTITLSKGTQVSCTLCHDNYINGEGDESDDD